jgi:hypothetical protein
MGTAPAGMRSARGIPQRPPGRSRSKVTPRQPAVSRIDVTRAKELLDTLFLNQLQPKTAHMVRDSAGALFNAPGISRRDQAYAAFVIGMTHLIDQPDRDHAKGCLWLRRAAQLDSAAAKYPQLANQAQCPP